MKVEIPYGKSRLEWEDHKIERVVRSRISKMRPEADQAELVEEAMKSPVESQRLEDLARGKDKAVIIISDHTRPVPSKMILPPMLAALRQGNPHIDITLLVATGCHRLTTKAELVEKLGQEMVETEKILIHDCDDRENQVSLGILPSGAELIVNKLAVECDLLLAEGFIEPHFFAGFSGGRKSILPGICSRKTVLGNHCSHFIDHPKARMGILDENPIHVDMTAAVRMAKLAYIVNVIIDEEKKVIAAFAGDPVAAHRKGCDYLLSYCNVSAEEKADIVITGNGGAPLDQNAYQAVKSMTTAESFAKEGGVIIVCAECADGIGGQFFYRKMKECANLDELMTEIMNTPMEETVPDQWQYQILVRIMKHHHVIMVCNPAIEEEIRAMKLDYATTLKEAVDKARKLVGENSSITVVPDGISVIGMESMGK
ncbi:MAG: nickel-dependent lactate racemase [Firmicutes bacterium]|nr:nickel-dependent lactate racemase [Bacillota bacterium]